MAGVTPLGVLVRFAADVLVRSGADQEQAESVAEALVWADAFGRPNQGVWRLPILSARLVAGLFHCPCRPSLESRASAVMLMDGDNGMGHHVGRLAVDAVVEKARDTGIAAVWVRNSNFLGALGHYGNRIAEGCMVGLAMSNSFPKVAPYGGLLPVLGTNPFSFAAPRRNGENVIVDLATAAMAGSDVTRSAGSGQPLPEGIATDRAGRAIRDASKVGEGALLPFGGAKGYALAVMVEILCGVAAGAGIAHGVRSMYRDLAKGGNNGHFFLAIDVPALMPVATFHERMEILVEAIRSCEDALLPGEARWRSWSRTESSGGVRVDSSTIDALTKLASEKGVPTPW